VDSDLKDLLAHKAQVASAQVDSVQVASAHKAQAALDLKDLVQAQKVDLALKVDSLVVLKDQVTLVDLVHKVDKDLVQAQKVDSLVLKDQVTLIISAALNKVQAALSQLLK